MAGNSDIDTEKCVFRADFDRVSKQKNILIRKRLWLLTTLTRINLNLPTMSKILSVPFVPAFHAIGTGSPS
jgi:hypothetical protein